MHGETVKFVGAQQAKLYNTYRNTKLKLLKTNAAIWFNGAFLSVLIGAFYTNILLYIKVH